MEPQEHHSTESVQAAGLTPLANSETIRHLIDTFGSTAMAVEWLNEFCPALGVRPVEVMEDSDGRLAIHRVLTCISHGMIY